MSKVPETLEEKKLRLERLKKEALDKKIKLMQAHIKQLLVEKAKEVKQMTLMILWTKHFHLNKVKVIELNEFNNQ